MRRSLTVLAAVLALTVPTAIPIGASPFPDVIDLPNGFFPEGIAIGNEPVFYTGSLIDGAIYSGDLRTGEGAVLVPGVEGQVAVGMDFDARSGNLFVAGGPSGTVRIYDTDSGILVDEVFLGGGFVNDVIVDTAAAYLTNSFVPEIYEVPLAANGQVAGPARVIPLGGDFQFEPGQFNANGIEVSGSLLLVVNSFFGTLYAVDPVSGDADQIDLGGEIVNGDGLVLLGRTLFAVVGSTNEIKKIRLAPDLARGVVVESLTDSDFDVPTTAARFGNSLYAVNAKFGTPATPDTPYEVVRVTR